MHFHGSGRAGNCAVELWDVDSGHVRCWAISGNHILRPPPSHEKKSYRCRPHYRLRPWLLPQFWCIHCCPCGAWAFLPGKSRKSYQRNALPRDRPIILFRAVPVPQWSYPVVFITCFVTAFALIIAISKDLPDVEGDKKNNIQTFASSVGVPKLAKLVVGSLFGMYLISAAVPFLFPGHFNAVSDDWVRAILNAKSLSISRRVCAFLQLVMTPLHSAFAVLMLVELSKLQRASFGLEAIKAFYRTIWTALYCEYICFPFI